MSFSITSFLSPLAEHRSAQHCWLRLATPINAGSVAAEFDGRQSGSLVVRVCNGIEQSDTLYGFVVGQT
jgi:hypothetical protein